MLVHKGVPPFRKGGQVIELEVDEVVVKNGKQLTPEQSDAKNKMINLVHGLDAVMHHERETNKKFIAEHPEAKVVKVPKPRSKKK